MLVHKKLRAGFLESIYHEALEKELGNQNIPFKTRQKLHVFYDNVPLKKYFIADFICFENIVVEIKAASFLHQNGEGQIINYLKSTNFPVGLLINFVQSSLTWKGFVNTET